MGFMMSHSKKAKRFFFEKKKQKTFGPAVAPQPGTLPASLRELPFAGLTLVRSATPSPYEQGLIEGSDWGTADVVWLLRRLLRRGGTLVDVGANIGLVALPIAADGTRVVAFEMLPANCLKLQLACLLNGLRRVRVLQAAISAEDGLVEYGGADAWGKIGAGVQQAVALRLDTALRLAGARLSRRSVIKIDVEGHELEVLQGAETLIAKHRPAILFESIEPADRADDAASQRCKRLLEQLGYRLFLQRGRRLLPRRAADLQEGVVADILAVPAEQPGWLRGLTLAELTPQERVDWVAESVAQHHPGHRRDAAAAVAKLRQEGPPYLALTAPLVATLLNDPEAFVRAKAEASGLAS